ncbi:MULTISPECIES: hypothetical protein [unclassified Streptomyces]|uniref:hypothetical protein n=1 Tax=unclassified Streptomyces TaxID=2593676 RepID=UPI0009388A73|nr:hypothetical protein [Streptomyces sp. TSRI0281]
METPDEHGRRSQKWNREAWGRSSTWKRTAWKISASDGRCLYQDDRELPARSDSRDRQRPELRLSDCGTKSRPELYWRWGG